MHVGSRKGHPSPALFRPYLEAADVVMYELELLMNISIRPRISLRTRIAFSERNGKLRVQPVRNPWKQSHNGVTTDRQALLPDLDSSRGESRQDWSHSV